MIRRLRQINDHLYRGGAPSIEDVIFLNRKLGINKIVSLDYDAGKRIDRATKLLGMKHIMLPIDMRTKSSLIHFLNQDISKLLDDNGPTFIHCHEGKDRTGLAIALYRCECDDWSCEDAIKEAETLGFGIGADPRIKALYIKLIKQACGCNSNKDENKAYDIVSNEREYPSDYRDYSLDIWEQGSWSPYADYRVREFPFAKQEIEWPEQYQSRLDYGLDDRGMVPHDSSSIPQIGTYDTSTCGIMGAGPSMIGTGII